jgi:hypothetical protein
VAHHRDVTRNLHNAERTALSALLRSMEFDEDRAMSRILEAMRAASSYELQVSGRIPRSF